VRGVLSVPETLQVRGGGPTPDGGQLVAVVDGPMAGQWYTLADWWGRCAAAERMTSVGQPPGACLGYRVATAATVPHPSGDGRAGQAARWER
jgi:hypothetical protein